MRAVGCVALQRREEVRVEDELQQMRGRGLALELGVRDFVGPRAEGGGNLHPLEEVRPVAPDAAFEGPLEPDRRPVPQCRARGLRG